MDKNKIIQAATKFVQKGQFDKAIKEYQRILEEDPKDIRILLKIGELHQKRGDNVQAAQDLLKVAEAYSNDGFFLKAAAVYKQVLKLNPNLVDVNLKLAELYQQLGLMSDALQQFQVVATAYEQQGNVQSALGTLKKLIELDPENVANRIRLAESFAREGMNREAIEEFQKVATTLREANRADEYVKVAERLSFLDPQDLTLARDLANVYLAKGDTKRALAKLQICFKADPKDVDTLVLLAQAFKELGQIAKTVSVYKELAKIYSDADRSDDERVVWRKILALVPDDPDAQRWQGGPAPVRAASAPAMAPAAPARPAAGPVAAPRAEAHGPEAVAKLLTETDVYLKYGLHAKAAEHIKKILALAPGSLPAHEKAKDLFLTMGDKARAADELVSCVRLAHAAGGLDAAQSHLRQLQEVVPDHPSIADLAAQVGAPVEASEIADDAILVEAAEEELLVAADGEEELVAASDDELLIAEPDVEEDEALFSEEEAQPGAAEVALIDGDESIVPEDESSEISLDEGSGSEELGEELVTATEEEALASTVVREVVEDESVEPALSLEPSVDEPWNEPPSDLEEAAEATIVGAPMPVVPVAKVEQPPARVPPPSEAPRRVAPPGVAVAPRPVSPPASPVSRPVPVRPPAVGASPEAAVPSRQQASSDRRSGSSSSAAPAAPAASPASRAPRPAAAGASSAGAPAAPKKAAAPAPAPPAAEEFEPEELAETEFFLEQGLLDEAREALEALRGKGLHGEALRKLEALEARLAAPSSGEGGAIEEEESFDLAAELEKEVEETRASMPPADDFQYSVEDVLRDFKKGIEKVVRPEDVETHYDLGIAYKEMGLTDEAISEFEQAAKGATGRPREADCLAMLGLCLAGKGEPQKAVEVFERALEIQGLRPESRLNLHYEIGAAKEGLGDVDGAMDAFQKVAGLDPAYRDVGESLARLKATPKSGTRKIGYV